MTIATLHFLEIQLENLFCPNSTRMAFGSRGGGCKSKEPLMVAFMNSEALEATLETGCAHFWSRSRGKLWMKGETLETPWR